MHLPRVYLVLWRSLFVSKSQHIVCSKKIFKTVLNVQVLLQHLYDIQLIKDEFQKPWNWKSVGRARAMQYYAVGCQLVQFDHQDRSNGCKPFKHIKWFIFVYISKGNELQNWKNISQSNLMSVKFNIILMGILAVLEKSDFLHGRMWYKGNSYLGNTVTETNYGQYRCLLFIIVEDLGHVTKKSLCEQKSKIYKHAWLF